MLTAPQVWTVLPGIAPTPCDTARTLNQDAPAGASHFVIQAIGGTLYVAANKGTASSSNYTRVIAEGGTYEYSGKTTLLSLQGVSYCADCLRPSKGQTLDFA
ncbi:MAG: hypothetical protein QM811_22575 [Pirellulales bacterium]